jgi:hypothetical protein
LVGVIGQQVTRGFIREKEANRSRELHQRELIEQGKELKFLTLEAERIGWSFVIALNT